MSDGERWHTQMGEIASMIARGEWPHEQMRQLRRIELAERQIADARKKLGAL